MVLQNGEAAGADGEEVEPDFFSVLVWCVGEKKESKWF